MDGCNPQLLVYHILQAFWTPQTYLTFRGSVGNKTIGLLSGRGEGKWTGVICLIGRITDSNGGDIGVLSGVKLLVDRILLNSNVCRGGCEKDLLGGSSKA